MLDGAQFVEAVTRLGYPGAAALKGEDFDWLFFTLEHQQFLRFFCGSITRSNVLSSEEVSAFQALRDSGKPILDEAALGEVLKTCQGGPSREPVSMTAWLEEADMASLEEELQVLRQEKKLKLRRLRKLQVLATARSDVALRLASRQEEGSQQLKNTVASLGGENAETNATLQKLSQGLKQLVGFLCTEPPAEERCSSALSLGRVAPVLLSQLLLEPYLRQQQGNTKALALLVRKQFFPGISDLVEASSPKNFGLLELGHCAGEGGEGVGQAHQAEVARMQWAHMLAQHRLLHTQAEESSVDKGLRWLTEYLSNKAKAGAHAAAPQLSESALEQELRCLHTQLEVLQGARVPQALRESARLLSVPVVHGDFNLQVARQDYYTSCQDQLCAHLLQQKASLELLQLAHELELRRGRQLRGQLGDAARRLDELHAALSRRLHTFSQPELGVSTRPSAIISSKDSAFSRLYKVVESSEDPEHDQPFRTYEGLTQAALGLKGALHSAREVLAGATQEQALGAGVLQGDCDMLRGAMHCRLQRPVLTPQALKEKLQHLESQLDNFNKLMKEMLVDVRSKREQLERSPMLRRERDLYVFFHLEPKLLRKTVEELEGRLAQPGARP